MMPIDQPSGSSQMVRIGLPFTFMGGAVADFTALSMPQNGVPPALAGSPAMPQSGSEIAPELAVAAIDYEVEYDNRTRVPEHPEIFARWMREAEDYRAEAYK